MARLLAANELWKVAMMAAVYYVSGKLGLYLAFGHPSATPVWPPTGFALAAVLVFGYRIVPGVFAGAFLVNLTTAGTVATSLGIACGNSLECLVGGWLVIRYAGGRNCLASVDGIFKFTTLAALGSTVVSATCGTVSLVLGGLADWHDAGSIWVTWWLGDASGNLLIAPMLLAWSTPRPIVLPRGRPLEVIALYSTLSITGLSVFSDYFSWSRDNYPVDFICIPVLMWAVFRFGIRESATAIVILAAIAIWGTLDGNGPFVRVSPNESLLLLQAYMGVASVMTLMLGAAVLERRAAEDQFRQLSNSDPLTGLANFRALMTCIGTEISRSERTGRPFGVLFIDVDGLKRINDEHGHLVGNRALCRVAGVLQISARSIDTAARFGGDEFALVLPETEPAEAWQAGHRIAERLASDPESPAVSVSLGLAVFPHDGLTAEALLGIADHQQYERKSQARGSHR